MTLFFQVHKENGYANHAFKPDEHAKLNDIDPINIEDSGNIDKQINSDNNEVKSEESDKGIIKNGGPKYKDKGRHLKTKVNKKSKTFIYI